MANIFKVPEIWLPVEGHPTLEVSNYSKIRRVEDKYVLGERVDGGYYKVRVRYQDRVVNLRVHRVLAKAFIQNPDNLPVIDHIDGDRLNNALSNLRWCTVAQNNQNSRKRKQNKSGFKGVSWHKQVRKWQASIKVNRKSHYLGYFTRLEDAALAYNRAAIAHFGPYARLNEIPDNLVDPDSESDASAESDYE